MISPPSYHTLVVLLNKYKDRLEELKIIDPLAKEVPLIDMFKNPKEKMK